MKLDAQNRLVELTKTASAGVGRATRWPLLVGLGLACLAAGMKIGTVSAGEPPVVAEAAAQRAYAAARRAEGELRRASGETEAQFRTGPPVGPPLPTALKAPAPPAPPSSPPLASPLSPTSHGRYGGGSGDHVRHSGPTDMHEELECSPGRVSLTRAWARVQSERGSRYWVRPLRTFADCTACTLSERAVDHADAPCVEPELVLQCMGY